MAKDLSRKQIIGWLAFLVAGAALFAMCLSVRTAPTIANSPSPTGEIVIVRDFVGCSDYGVYDKSQDYVAQNDHQALEQFLDPHVKDGSCTLLAKGTPVFIAETKAMASRVRLRPKGSVKEYWTQMRAIQ